MNRLVRRDVSLAVFLIPEAAPRLWNKLLFEIRACSDVNLFKSKLKTFLFKKVYDI